MSRASSADSPLYSFCTLLLCYCCCCWWGCGWRKIIIIIISGNLHDFVLDRNNNNIIIMLNDEPGAPTERVQDEAEAAQEQIIIMIIIWMAFVYELRTTHRPHGTYSQRDEWEFASKFKWAEGEKGDKTHTLLCTWVKLMIMKRIWLTGGR